LDRTDGSRDVRKIEDGGIDEIGRVGVVRSGEDRVFGSFGECLLLAGGPVDLLGDRRILALAVGALAVAARSTTTATDLAAVCQRCPVVVRRRTHRCRQYWQAIEMRCRRLGEELSGANKSNPSAATEVDGARVRGARTEGCCCMVEVNDEIRV
jgi:hypothetical protein